MKSKPRSLDPSPAELQAAMAAMLAFQDKSSIKADLEGIARAALIAAAAARRAARKGGKP